MRKLPVSFFGRDGSIRPDGRVIYPVSLYAVKEPSESHYAWDYLKEVARIDPGTAFRSMKDGGCSLVQQ
jgi:branched-chain amino acid transport system substrate-binding protein